MAPSRPNELQTEKSESEKMPARYRFELSRVRLFLYSCAMVLSLCWMFTFGVLVGRGVPFVDITDTSLKAHFFRFLGLGKEVAPVPENVAETWDPQAVLQSLSYYKNLTQRDASAAFPINAPASAEATTIPADLPGVPAVQPAKPAIKEASNQSQKQKSPPAQAALREQSIPEPTPRGPANDPTPPSNAGEHFSLLICSLRDADSAQRLLDQLKSKGYTPRIETLDLQDGGRWNRVLVGSFRNREEALRFAADFNRKERMEGLVIRETR